jgi:hypothetical protein
MKRITILALVASLYSFTAYAHPGRTASDGCHYCRTNCAQWGVQQGARHCHGGLKPELETILLERSVSSKSKTKKLEVTHSHGPEGTHTHEEQYN